MDCNKVISILPFTNLIWWRSFNYYIFNFSRVDLSPDQFHGKLYGKLVWGGVPSPKEELIRSPLKKQWSLIDFPDYTKFQGTPSDIQKLIPPAKPFTPKSK